jgi:hypothetical protein
MPRFLKTYSDDRLRLKVAVLRGVCLLMLASWVVTLLFVGASGRFDVTSSRSGTRFGSPSITRTITWSDSPLMYVFQLAWHFLIGAALVAAFYVVLARLIEHFHGRRLPFFRRKYPY